MLLELVVVVKEVSELFFRGLLVSGDIRPLQKVHRNYTALIILNYKVGMAVIKGSETRVVVMVTNTRRHPYIYI